MKSITVNPVDLVKHYEIELNNALQMKITADVYGLYALTNMIIS